jgi:hypothetical protein
MSDINLPIKFWNVNTPDRQELLKVHFPNCEFVTTPHEADILVNPQDLKDPTFPTVESDQLFSAYINPSPTYSVLHDHVSSIDFVNAGIERFKIDYIGVSPYSEFCNIEDYQNLKANHPDTEFNLIYSKYASEKIVDSGTLNELESKFPNEFSQETTKGVVFPDKGRYYVIVNAKNKPGFTRSYGFGGFVGTEFYQIVNIHVPKRIQNAVNLMLAPHCGWFCVEFYPEDGFHKLHTVRWGLRDEHFNQWFWNTDSGNQLLGVFNEAIIGGKPMLGYEGELVGHGG